VPGANALIIDYMRRTAKRDQVVAEMARKYRDEHKSIDGFASELADWTAKNPLFNFSAEIKAAQAAGGVDALMAIDASRLLPDERRALADAIDAATKALAPAPTEGAVATPQTLKELNALPSGTIYINPADGKRYKKK
jgi:hypothetical protein